MQRFVTGLLASLIWIAILFSRSFPLLWLASTLIGGMALHEYFGMCLAEAERSARPLATAIGLLPFLAAWGQRPDLLLLAFLVSLWLAALLVFCLYARLNNGLLLLAKLVLGLGLISLAGSHLPLFFALPHGFSWLAILTVITVASDTGAYYCGTRWGRTKLCPGVSPGKTVEGLLGGLAASLGCTFLAGGLLLPGASAPRLAGAALALTMLGVGGDLTESIVKRSCRVKDSGSLLPGHGGVLDRIDSLLAAGPALYYLIRLGVL